MKRSDTEPMHPADRITVIIGRICRSGMTATPGKKFGVQHEDALPGGNKEVEELRVAFKVR